MTNHPRSDEPLTCSEVVERLAAECLRYRDDEGAKLDRPLAIKILTEWRERRVQELEELIAKRSGSPQIADSASNSNSSTQHRGLGGSNARY